LPISNPLLALGLSTIVGALVGYFTNVVAVRLLFRPYRPVRILFLRVQGLIPSKREEIARRLASIVSSYVSHGDIAEGLKPAITSALRERIRRGLREAIGDGLLYSIVGGYIDSIASRLADYIASLLESFVLRDAAREVDVSEIVARKVSELNPREMEELFKRLAGRELRFIELSGLVLGGVVGLLYGVVSLILGL